MLDARKDASGAQSLLARLAGDAASYELLDAIEREASNRNLPGVRAAALERRIELTRDPVEKLRRRLELVRLHEALNDTAAAETVSAAIHADHPRLLGVVRARTDFLWRNRRRPQAIATLVEAAGQAHSTLAAQLRFEAAEKAIQAERYDQARGLLTTLLEAEPFQPSYLAAMADSYARQGRDEELRGFYQQRMEALDATSLSADAKRSVLALLRRGLIPALERLGDHVGATDQYIELVNRFPDDAALAEEAGLYALRHQQSRRLEQAYERTAEASPRDVRYHRVLARLRLLFENPAGALEAYEEALAVRPDSVELQSARAGLLERLLRFEDAREAYNKLYELSYQDPRWMLKVGEIEARLGDSAAAEQAVRRARVDGRPARPENFFGAAETLEGWGLVQQALGLAEQGLDLAGGRLYRDFRAARASTPGFRPRCGGTTSAGYGCARPSPPTATSISSTSGKSRCGRSCRRRTRPSRRRRKRRWRDCSIAGRTRRRRASSTRRCCRRSPPAASPRSRRVGGGSACWRSRPGRKRPRTGGG